MMTFKYTKQVEKANWFRRISCIMLIVALVSGMLPFVHGAAPAGIDGVIAETGAYLQNTVKEPQISSIGGEWTILGLSRSILPAPQSYYDNYYAAVVTALKERQGVLTSVKYTEYSRVILALTALGKDVTNVGGYDLLAKLADYNSVLKQGVNGPVFALIALDSHDYPVPTIAGISSITTRQKLIDYILSKEIVAADGIRGGFALTGSVPDPDLTGMVLQALSRHQNQTAVKAVVDRALIAISGLQQTDGEFLRWGSRDSETLAQVITGLCALGIDPSTDRRFIKTDSSGVSRSLLDALLSYRAKGGGFEHVKGAGINLMATEQAMYALTSYHRLLAGKTPLYDMNDVTVNKISVLLNGKALSFDQPPVNLNGRVLVPLRVVFQSMGAEMQWNQTTQTVTATRGSRTIVLTIGATTAYVDGNPVLLDVPGRILGGRTLVPVRFIAQSLDGKVEWIQASSTVVITQ